MANGPSCKHKPEKLSRRMGPMLPTQGPAVPVTSSAFSSSVSWETKELAWAKAADQSRPVAFAVSADQPCAYYAALIRLVLDYLRVGYTAGLVSNNVWSHVGPAAFGPEPTVLWFCACTPPSAVSKAAATRSFSEKGAMTLARRNQRD